MLNKRLTISFVVDVVVIVQWQSTYYAEQKMTKNDRIDSLSPYYELNDQIDNIHSQISDRNVCDDNTMSEYENESTQTDKQIACQKVLRILFPFIWPPIFGDIRKPSAKINIIY